MRAHTRKLKLQARWLRTQAHGKAIIGFLLDALSATTTYNEPVTPRTPRVRPSTDFYGSKLALVPDESKLLGSDGKPTAFKLERQWTAQPGEIITDRRGQKYSVRPDHSLRKL